MAHRELLRVWTGFATNHMERREWREAREIWRAILRRFEGDLLAEELAEVRTQIEDCDIGLEEGRVPGTTIAASSPARP
jgi:hypothetical protein